MVMVVIRAHVDACLLHVFCMCGALIGTRMVAELMGGKMGA